MTRGRDEEFENKWSVGNHTNANYFSSPVDKVSRDAAEYQGVRKGHQDPEEFSGYIFMCNGRTKPECYLNRVFGLPAGRKNVIDKIRPGMKLFLFDYEVKFLYGVYEATTPGKLNLERTAFGGNFPAQVRFKIYKECLPLPESEFKPAIQDNYRKGFKKFNTVLNSQQVSHLLSLFHPITMQSSPKYDSAYIKDQFQPSDSNFKSMHPSHAPQVSVPQYVPQAVLFQQWNSPGLTGNMGACQYSVDSQPAMPAQSTEDQFQYSTSLPSMKDPNAALVYGGLTSPLLEPQYSQLSVQHPQHVTPGYTVNMGYVYPSVQRQPMLASTQTYYSAEYGQHYLTEVPAQQAPTSYESYHTYDGAAQDRVAPDQQTGFCYGYNLHQVPNSGTGATPPRADRQIVDLKHAGS